MLDPWKRKAEGELGQVGNKAGKSLEVWVHPDPVSHYLCTHVPVHTHTHIHIHAYTVLGRLQAKARGLPSTYICFI